MKSKSSSRPTRRTRRAKAKVRSVSVPLQGCVEEALARMPAVFGAPGAAAKRKYLMLAAYEGVLAMAEYFEAIEGKRRVCRSDLMFRFDVVPRVIGRAARAEMESRAIDAVLAAAAKAAL